MMQIVLGWLKDIFNLCSYVIAPPVCYVCSVYLVRRTILCDSCDIQILPIAPKLIRINSHYTMIIHAISRYDDPIKQMILAKHGQNHIILKGLAELMWQKTILKNLTIDCFVPIPLHWTRRIKRGFNQAELFARHLALLKKVPVYTIVQRKKRTEYQAKLEKTAKKENVKDAFIIKNGELLINKHVLLIDDLCTTGSTAVEIAKLLTHYKPASIQLIVACRAL